MRRLLLASGGVALVGGVLLGMAPSMAAGALRGEGFTVEGARWTADGLTLYGVGRGEARVTRVRVGWDRVVRLEGAVVPVGAVRDEAAVPDAPATTEVPGWARALVRSVEVDDLEVPGAPLPRLGGTVWPERRLVGDGVTIDGDTVRAALATPVGAVEIEAARGGAGIDLVIRCAACTVPAPSAEDAPLPLPPVVARGVWADGAFTGTVRADDVEAHVVARPVDGGAEADVTVAAAPIASVYGLFAAWVPEVRHARIEGTVVVTARVRWNGEAATDALTLERFAPTIEGLTVDGLVPDTLAGGPFLVRGGDAGSPDALYPRGEGTPEWVPLAEMGPWLPAAVISAEDAGFRAHPGYDLDGMRDAAAKNVAEGGIVRGGSTLTQQLAKNLFLDGTRSYARKLRELLYAVEMERELGKHRILELYLNVVEFGPGIRGAKAAADTYFLKAPAGLLPEEAAWLASILRFPKTAYKRQYLQGDVDASRVRWILENLRGVPEEARTAALGRTVRLVPP